MEEEKSVSNTEQTKPIEEVKKQEDEVIEDNKKEEQKPESVEEEKKQEEKPKEDKKDDDVQCSDPEIEAWLNAGENDDKERYLRGELKINEDDISEEKLPQITEDQECLPVIENHSEVPYNDDPEICEISDKMVLKMMKQICKGGHFEEELEDFEEEEEELKEKKMNRNSRAAKKAREEKQMAAKKQKEEKEKKERERLKELSEKHTSKYNYERPTKKTTSSLQKLALKQKQGKKDLTTHKKPEVKTTAKHVAKPVKKEDVDIHKIFNRKDRSMDPKLARILYDTSVLPKASTKPPVKPKEFSFTKRGTKK